MAASISLSRSHTAAGFYKASVTKSLMGGIGVSHFAWYLAMFSPLQRYFVCKIPDSLRKGEWWRLLTSKITFVDGKDALFCLLLMYFFRIFERRLGSRKFFSHLLAMMTLTGIIEGLVTSIIFQYRPHNHSGLLSTGPFGAILPFFISYYYDIPRLSAGNLVNLAVSPKTMAYMVGLQVVATSKGHTIVGFSAMLAGFIHRINFLWIQNWFVIPQFVANIFHSWFGRFIDSAPPLDEAVGASLEIQRAQHLEAMEQQILAAQARATNQGNQQRYQPFWTARAGPNQEPTAENIQLLMDMGFHEDRARAALREAHNDLATATAILLRHT